MTSFKMLSVHVKVDVCMQGPIWVHTRADMGSCERTVMGLESGAVSACVTRGVTKQFITIFSKTYKYDNSMLLPFYFLCICATYCVSLVSMISFSCDHCCTTLYIQGLILLNWLRSSECKSVTSCCFTF